MKSEAEYFDFVEDPVPTRSHREIREVGTESLNKISAVPTVPTVPTVWGRDRAEKECVDLDAFEERAAIIEHDGEHPHQEAETRAAQEQGFADAEDLHGAAVARWTAEIDRLSKLRAVSPESAEALKRAQTFIHDGWALQAARLGWDECQLFGVCPRAPWARLDRKGAAFGGAVQAVTQEAITYVGGLRRYRAQVNNDGGAVPIWELVGASE